MYLGDVAAGYLACNKLTACRLVYCPALLIDTGQYPHTLLLCKCVHIVGAIRQVEFDLVRSRLC